MGEDVIEVGNIEPAATFSVGGKKYLRLDAERSRGSLMIWSRDDKRHGYAVDIATGCIVEFPVSMAVAIDTISR